jgi:hypothetical protein
METTKLFAKREVGAETTVKSGVSSERYVKSRLIFLFFSLLTAVALSVSFSSCKDDDDKGGIEDSDWTSYVEVVIDGRKYTNYAWASGTGNDDEFFRWALMGYISGLGSVSEFKTPDADISFDLVAYQHETNLKTATTGKYRIGTDYDNHKNFDLDVYISAVGSGYYKYISGTHNVTNIKRLSVNSKDYTAVYLVEGTFSGTFTHSTSDKTIEMTEGKYWMKLEVDTERE